MLQVGLLRSGVKLNVWLQYLNARHASSLSWTSVQRAQSWRAPCQVFLHASADVGDPATSFIENYFRVLQPYSQ